jgi:hypothetical protein
MLDELHAAYAAEEKKANSTTAREKLAQMVANGMESYEDAILRAGGHEQIAAVHKAQEALEAFVQENNIQHPIAKLLYSAGSSTQ